MPEPQIARRCPTCGVAIREVALFCPQCGNALPPRSSVQSQSTGDSPLDEADRKDTAPLDDAEVRSQANFSDTLVIERPDNQSDARSMSDTLAIDKTQLDPAPRVRGPVGERLQRATSMARGVEGDVVQRVQKVREISSVVIDEAAYDPSLRFVLVAIIVFGLFLLIVLLNKFIT